jgi:L-alanine-DL-glutamate epimerase-like enolase superfamily enzyme
MAAITTVRCRPLSQGRMKQLLVDVETSAGHAGTGECWWGIASAEHGEPPDAAFRPMQAAVEALFAPRCIGADADDIEALWFRLADWAARYGDGGIIMMALAGIDLALWDLKAKRLGVPAVQLLGGRAHERLPVYASLPPLRSTEAVVRACRRAQAAGFNAFKLHEIEVAIVRETRVTLGNDAVLMVDVNGHFDTEEAIAFGRAIADCGIFWYEEPVRPMRNHDAIARVAAAQPLPLAAGENEYSLDDFHRLLSRNIVRWLQPEITKIGGLTPARKVAALAELHNVALAPHNFRNGPALYSSIHWGFSSPATRWLELPWLPDGVDFPCGAVLPAVEDGMIGLPDGTGFGLRV